MARMQPELRKQELIEIAFRQFLQQGYHKTSIRSIVGEAKGEIGMFYHHFSSKEEIFHEVLEQYNKQYINKVKNLIAKENKTPILELMELVFSDLEDSLYEYAHMNRGAVNKQMLTLLHQQTLLTLKPVFCDLLKERILRGEIALPEVDIGLLTDFLLYGISAVLHDQDEKNIKAKEQAIRLLMIKMLEC
ncbi:TetR/AcrR family transcriptional regulator [Lachnospiraceae bacterium MD1]|uniref:TetR/AcrR family transcriptional regulator n=1 Tax=Variimorphobacter saccharofermentans TaxID=2755051 RepID=A0A839K1X1_9FIRM|nr:TetR/AcrR family transcriptional regulator [Variimorphobacter saccharofermentans]MBB2183408.1 TetR/AcrR family transcriptional regulator [Variimorphobacter saccharofermentans]